MSDEQTQTDGLTRGPITALGDVPAATIIDLDALARMFGCCTATIKRATRRGELPHPVKMFGRKTWTAGRIVEHVEARLAKAQRQAEKDAARLSRLSP